MTRHEKICKQNPNPPPGNKNEEDQVHKCTQDINAKLFPSHVAKSPKKTQQQPRVITNLNKFS